MRLASRFGRVNSVRRDRPLITPVAVRYRMMISAPGAAIFIIDQVSAACAGWLRKKAIGLPALTSMAMPNSAPNCD